MSGKECHLEFGCSENNLDLLTAATLKLISGSLVPVSLDSAVWLC